MAALSTEREYRVRAARPGSDADRGRPSVGWRWRMPACSPKSSAASRHLAFLNNISKTAISSEDAEQMMADIVREIQKNFRFDHIGIGIMDYATKDIEIKAEAGTTAQALGQAHSAGSGHPGPGGAHRRERAGAERRAEDNLQGVLPESRAVLCLPDHLRRDSAGRAQRGEPRRKCIRAAGRSDHEHAGRLAGDRAAQFIRVPETAAAIDHRRADRHQDAALLLGGA